VSVSAKPNSILSGIEGRPKRGAGLRDANQRGT